MITRRLAVAVILAAMTAMSLPAQAGGRNLDLYYRFPLSLGARYESVNPYAAYGAQFNVYGMGATVIVPVPRAPRIQPFLEATVTRFNAQDPEEAGRWDHSRFGVLAGPSWMRRLSREFEIGGLVGAGGGLTVFPDLVEEPVGYATFSAATGIKLGLNPTYNFSVAIEPRLVYQSAMAELDRFDGISFSIGLSAHVRFGEDPDSAANAIRALRFSNVDVPDLFAAMQSYYASNPFGSVVLENTERTTAEEVVVSFFQPGLMDTPTVAAEIGELRPGEPVTVPLKAVYNSSVFDLEGITPLSGEIIVSYSLRGRPAEQRQTVGYDLHDKTALTWDDDRKLAAFITPADSAIRNYQSALLRYTRDAAGDGIPEAMRAAITAYVGLEELGIAYQADPTSPFVAVQQDVYAVDSVNLARDTLRRMSGDCDDLTVLFATMLETVGVETGFITVPGHVYPVFNTGVPASQFDLLHPERSMTINVDGELWVPVEVTLLGSADFRSAWRRGIELYLEYGSDPEVSGFYRTADARSIFRPVGLRQTDLGLQYGDDGDIRRRYAQQITLMVDTVLDSLEARAVERNRSRDYNRLGIAAARKGRFSRAEEGFRAALRLDANYVDAQINLGALQLARGRYTLAILTLQDLAVRLGRDESASPRSRTTVYLNLARAHYELDEFEPAAEYFELAHGIDPERAAAHSFIAAVQDSDGGRAAQVSGAAIPFAGDE